MKNIILTSLVITIFSFLISCKRESIKTNHFTSQNDTLIIHTEKKIGDNLFDYFATSVDFTAIDSFNSYTVTVPKNILEPKIGEQIIDWKIYSYLQYKKGEITNKWAINDVLNNKLDTTIVHNNKNNSISILSGKKNNQKVFIVDENNNKDFRDDTIRNYKEMNWNPTKNDLIEVNYYLFNEKEVALDTSWLNIGTSNNKLLFSVVQNAQASITIDNHKYQIGIKNTGFSFDNPIGAIISENGIKKDSLIKSEILELGEYFKLNNQYYKFESISYDGDKIKLIKEKDVSDKIGTQVGFIAPDFKCSTIKKDTISLSNYKNEYLLLTNVSSCYSKINSYECYKELYEAYNTKIKILAIDNSPNFLNFQINRLDLEGNFIIADENPLVKENYRQDFCSRTCFLINPNGTIVDKFEIFDWKQMLSNHFKE